MPWLGNSTHRVMPNARIYKVWPALKLLRELNSLGSEYTDDNDGKYDG